MIDTIYRYFTTTTDCVLDSPYHKVHLENGFDAILVGRDGMHGRYRLLMFDAMSNLIYSMESNESFTMEKELFDWANFQINNKHSREFIVNDAVTYLDKHVVDDAGLWALMTREARIMENRKKRNKC